jgi:hypothetical protein
VNACSSSYVTNAMTSLTVVLNIAKIALILKDALIVKRDSS